MTNILPVLLSGGSGTRLWPLSRKSYPKQFSNIFGDKSLFQQTALRLISSNIIKLNPPLSITNSNFRFIVAEQLQSVGVNPGPIILEPKSKNTGPSILAASLFALNKNENEIILVAPTDHLISNADAFHKIISEALEQVALNNIVTFGINPTACETGYGYMKVDKKAQLKPSKIIKFIEKPDKVLADKMVKSGNFLWNSGIFMGKARIFVDAFKKHHPQLYETVKKSIEDGQNDLGFFRLSSEHWINCDSVSFDYAIMEKINNIVTIPYKYGWSDLGDWNSIHKAMRHDEHGVSISKHAHAIECKNTLLRSETDQIEVVGLGLENILAVVMSDAVLITHKDFSQNVKKISKTLENSGISQAKIFSKEHRPWGYYEIIFSCDEFQIKCLHLKGLSSLSLQSHKYRSEHWVVVNGIAKVTIDNEVSYLESGQSIYVPVGSIHRMENINQTPLVVVEVQLGEYFKEDDIVRYEDLYGRR